MINKLKRKFVLINMCLVGVVMLIVFFVYGMNTYEQAKEEVTGALNMAVENTGEEKPKPFELGMPKRKPMGPMHYAVVVTYVTEENGEKKIVLQREENASMSRDVMKEAVDAALSSEKETGRLDDMALFYMKRAEMNGTRIAFADSSYFDSKIRRTLTTAVLLFLAGMTALLIISLFLANLAVEPVKKAWQQQKRFVADASHELKTPLTVMLANNEILMENASEDMVKWLESSRQEADRMKGLVDDLLLLARADEASDLNSAAGIDKNLADISKVITGAALQMEPVIFEAGIEFENKVEEGIHTECNTAQIEQLIHILLDNAAKYTAPGEKISLRLVSKGNSVQLQVNNTAEVIDKEDLKHIFERFYRSDKSRSGEGCGLGLSIAKTIVENHGGTISAASDKETGTTMTVRIPKHHKK